MSNENITSFIESLSQNTQVFSTARALEFWGNAGSSEFLNMVIYLTGLKVDWILQFTQHSPVPVNKDFFDVAKWLGLLNRSMAICTGIEIAAVSRLLKKHRIKKTMIDEIADHIITVQSTAMLMIKSQEFLYYKKSHPMQIPGDPNGAYQ